MRGPDGVRDAIASLLGEVLPQKVPALRAFYRLTREQSPDVEIVSSGEIPMQAIGDLGDVYIEVVNPRLMAGMQRVDIDGGYPVYRQRYACRVYSWVIGDEWSASITRRDQVVNAVRQSLLEFPTLSTTPGDTGYLLHHDTYTEEYGSPVRVDNSSGRAWSSGLSSVEMWSEESTRPAALRAPIGEVAQTSLGTTLLGPTEAMPSDMPDPWTFRREDSDSDHQ